MKWFEEKELKCHCGCNMPAEVKENTEALVKSVLDPTREKFGYPIMVNSCYRCDKHNKAVGGAANSQHVKGQAADICADPKQFSSTKEWQNDNLEIARIIYESGQWDQMILEDVKPGSLAPRWVHVSWKKNGINRREVRKKVIGSIVYPLLTDKELLELKRRKK